MHKHTDERGFSPIVRRQLGTKRVEMVLFAMLVRCGKPLEWPRDDGATPIEVEALSELMHDLSVAPKDDQVPR